MLTVGIVCVGFLLQVTQGIPAPGHGMLAGYCITNSDCHQEECCVSFIQPRGKRLFLSDLSPELEQLVKGRCVKRGGENPSDYCILNGAKPAQSDIFYHCPCLTGYTCEGTGRRALPDGEIGTCNRTMERSTRACNSGENCASDECCVSDNRPIGKRTSIAVHSHCQPMGTAGSGCLVSLGSGKPNGTGFACPCTSGLTCQGLGVYDVPLGEMGKCGA